MTTKCDCCGHEVLHSSDNEAYCSEFCAAASDEAKQLFQSGGLKAGDFGSWPCSHCGCWVEDEYVPGGFCGDAKCRLSRADALREKVRGILRQAIEAQADAGDSAEAFRLMDEAYKLLGDNH